MGLPKRLPFILGEIPINTGKLTTYVLKSTYMDSGVNIEYIVKSHSTTRGDIIAESSKK